MKVGILTYHFSDNYGALMQAYSLREFLRREGFIADFINYHPKHVEDGGSFNVNLTKLRKNATILYMKMRRLHKCFLGDAVQLTAFDEFRKKNLGVNGIVLADGKCFSAIEVPDVLICGSDQIWSPSVQYGLDPVYFLNFPGAERSRRISYAASFGRAELESNYRVEAAQYLRGLQRISVREESGVSIVKEISGRDAVCVPDPTFLLQNFDDLLSLARPTPESQIFCYSLRSTKIIHQVATHVGARLSIRVISPRSINPVFPRIGSTIYPSPVEWLAHLNSAKFVVSNSFHGVALAILLKRPFIAVALPGKKRAFSERVINLLKQTDLCDRIVFEYDQVQINNLIQSEINWNKVNLRVDHLRSVGSAFLREELQQA